MRHLGSAVLGIVFAPLVLLLAGRGLTQFAEAVGGFDTDPLATVIALAALSLAGLLYAALTLPRFSPIGPALAGVGYLGFSALILVGPADLLDRLRAEGIRLDEGQVIAAAGAAAMLAVPLLLTLFSGQRWRGRESAAPEASYSPNQRTLADTQDMPTVPLY